MSLDLQKLTLRRLLDTKSPELYSKLSPQYFTGANLIVFGKIQSFYKANLTLPSSPEFTYIKKDPATQEYLENQILEVDNVQPSIANEFLVSQLQDFCIRELTLEWLDAFLNDYESYEMVEIIDQIQDHLLSLNKTIPISDECFDIADLDILPDAETFKLFSSGLSHQYDSTNGGLGLSELVLLGGRRGSGKSIISLNLALHRYKQDNTVAFFTIEMRYKEVYDRLLSIVSGVPFLSIFRNDLSSLEKLQIARSKIDWFYEKDDYTEKLLKNLEETKDFDQFKYAFADKKPPYKKNRFLLIDDESLTLNRIDHYSNMFANKYKNFTMSVVDYLNIVNIQDSKDWKSQIVIAEELKRMARKYDKTMLSPYQIDATGEARYAKGILDAADRAFAFFPREEEDSDDGIQMHTTKIRNGRAMNFDVPMDWSCIRINPSKSTLTNQKAHKAAKYGSDRGETEKDLS